MLSTFILRSLPKRSQNLRYFSNQPSPSNQTTSKSYLSKIKDTLTECRFEEIKSSTHRRVCISAGVVGIVPVCGVAYQTIMFLAGNIWEFGLGSSSHRRNNCKCSDLLRFVLWY